jgi:CBS domain-containing protein
VLVRDVMTQPAITVGPSDTVRLVGELMLKHHIHGVPVVDDDNHLLGIVLLDDLIKRETRPTHLLASISSEDAYDVMENYRQEYDRIMGVTASSIMRADPPPVAPEDPVAQAAGIMVNEDMDMLPVVEDDKVVGVVSEWDILKMIHATGAS